MNIFVYEYAFSNPVHQVLEHFDEAQLNYRKWDVGELLNRSY